MSADPIQTVVSAIAERGDLAHLALFTWAATASLLVRALLRETAAASRRFDEFVRELASFNRRHSGDP